MRRLIPLLAACLLMAAGCLGGRQKEAVGQGFTFEEMFTIFSCFGEDVMTDIFSSQSTKDDIQEELEKDFNKHVERNGSWNRLFYVLADPDCLDNFDMACYRYKKGGRVLVLLSESGGCDTVVTKYFRAFEYDPARGSVSEAEIPYDEAPPMEGAGEAWKYDYGFGEKGLTVWLANRDDLVARYVWDGTSFVRSTGK